jgi:tryptophanyl-tRNA synthetase
MTQFKEKSKKHPESINAGLLNYPVLMAADILLYQTDLVTVGLDQKQHVELTREIARKFNRKFGRTFKLPQAQLQKIGAKIMSLQDPSRKMSKTDSPQSCISIFDSARQIKEKIMAAVTDSGKEIIYETGEKPGISNLLTIYSLFSAKPIKKIEQGFQGKGYLEFKEDLANLLSHTLSAFREKRKELLKEKGAIKKLLADGAKKARAIASLTLKTAKQKMGLM